MTTMLHVRMDDELKEKGNKALSEMGLTASDAVRILYHRIVAEQAFPLELKVPNKVTREAMEEARSMTKEQRTRFRSGEELEQGLEE